MVISGLPTGAVITWNGLNYTITNVAAGPQTLRFAKPNYNVTNSPQTVTVPPAGTVAVPLVVAFSAVGTVTGTISGVADATGVVISGLPTGAVITWNGLNYTITNVSVGAQTLSFAKTNYNVTNSPQTVTVPPAETVAVPLTVAFSANPGTITGVISGVADATGVVISGLPTGAVITWNGLNYTITNATAGIQTLVIAKPGYLATPSTQNITVPAGGTITATPVALSQATVNFTITDSVTYAPIAGVEITLATTPVKTTTTDQNGKATLPNVPINPAGYALTITAPGYQPVAQTVVVNQATIPVIASMVRLVTGTVRATVKYSDGSNVPNGTVITATSVLAGGPPPYQGTTTSGVATITGMTPGSYNVKATLGTTDYDATNNPIAVQGNLIAAATITGPANPLKTGITATVKYTDGTNVPNGTVVTATGTKVYTGTTTNGTVTILGMDPGSYVVKANINSVDYNANENPVTVVANAIATATINSANNPVKGWITATVKYTDTTPVNGVIVTATPVAGGAVFTGTTGSNGVAQILNIVPGAYNVSATISGSPCNASQNPVVVVANQNSVATITGPNNPLKGTVSATVKYSDGSAVSGVTVTMTPVGAGTTYSGTTNSNGVVQQDNMLLGQYTVKATIAGTDYNATENPVTVSGGSVSIATITGPANPLKTGITATVKYTDGTNVSDGTIVTATGSAVYTGTTVAGIATLTGMVPGSYNVKATLGGTDYPATGNPITVAANASTAVGIATGNNPATGTLNVTVSYTDTTAISGVVVTANNGGTPKQATTNGNGLASFYGLSAGTYSTSVPINGVTYNGAPTAVVVGQTATVAITGPNNPNYGYANITVAYSNGDPVGAGQTVTMTSGVNHPTAVTNGSSVAAFTQLLAGTYTATVTINSVVYSQANVTVAVGQTAAATITGPANPNKGSVTLTLTGSGGGAISNQTVSLYQNNVKIADQVTNGSGIVNFIGLLPGTYVAATVLSGHTYTNNAIEIVAGTNTIAAITVPRSAAIYVTAYYVGGSVPMPSYEVTAVSTTNGSIKQTALTGEDGKVVFTSMISGQYYVYIRKTETIDYPPAPEQIWASSPYPITCDMVTPGYGTIIGPAAPGIGEIDNLRLYSDVQKTVELTTADSVELYPPSGGPTVKNYVIGGVSFAGLAMGTYTVGVRIGGGGALKAVVTNKELTLIPESPIINDANGYVIPDLGNVSVVVNSDPVVNGNVTATNQSTLIATTVATQSGTATFASGNSLVPGTYKFTFAPGGITIYGDNPVNILPNKTIISGSNPTINTTDAAYRTDIYVQVVDKITALPIAGASVSITSVKTATVAFSDLTDVNGNITTKNIWWGVPSGTSYTFTATAAGHTTDSTTITLSDINPIDGKVVVQL